jgi:hypothetical protein
VATAFVLIKGRHLLAPQDWAAWEHCIEQTMARTATEEGALVNWRAQLFTAADEKPRLLMQFCHGVPAHSPCTAWRKPQRTGHSTDKANTRCGPVTLALRSTFGTV